MLFSNWKGMFAHYITITPDCTRNLLTFMSQRGHFHFALVHLPLRSILNCNFQVEHLHLCIDLHPPSVLVGLPKILWDGWNDLKWRAVQRVVPQYADIAWITAHRFLFREAVGAVTRFLGPTKHIGGPDRSGWPLVAISKLCDLHLVSSQSDATMATLLSATGNNWRTDFRARPFWQWMCSGSAVDVQRMCNALADLRAKQHAPRSIGSAMQSDKFKFMVLVSTEGVVSLKKIEKNAIPPTFNDVVKNKDGHDSLVVFSGESGAAFSVLSKTKNDAVKISRYQTKLIAMLASRVSRQSVGARMTSEPPLEVPLPKVVPAPQPTPGQQVPALSTPGASMGQFGRTSDFLPRALLDSPPMDYEYARLMSPVPPGGQCGRHLPSSEEPAIAHSTKSAEFGSARRAHTQGSRSLVSRSFVVEPVAGCSGWKPVERKKPRPLEGPDVAIPRWGAAHKSIRAGFDESSTDTAESDDSSSQEMTDEAAASRVSKPQGNQAAIIARTDQQTPEKKVINDAVPATPGNELPHDKLHLIKITFFSMERKNDMPDFFLIADSQSPGLQSLPELHRLTQDRSGDPKVLRKAEIVYSQLYITTEALYALMNELLSADQLLAQSVPPGATFLTSTFQSLDIDPAEGVVYIFGVHAGTEWRAFDLFSGVLKKHTRKVYETFTKAAGSRRFAAMGGSCLTLSPHKKVKTTPVKILALAAGVKKNQYCYFCGKNFRGNIMRHLRLGHMQEPEIQDLYAAKPSAERMRAFFSELRLLGNEQHNATVLQCRQGTLVPSRRSQTASVRTTNKCPYCLTLHTSRNFKRHLQICRTRRGVEAREPAPPVDLLELNRIEQLRTNLDQSYTVAVDKILNNMRDKRIASFIITDDQLVIRVVKNFGLQQETGNNGVQISRRNIRLLYALYTAFKVHAEIPGLVTSLRDICKRSVWQGLPSNRPASKTDRIIEVIHTICGGEENRVDFKRPNDVMTLSSLIRQVASELQQERFEDEAERKLWTEECRLLIEYLETKRYRIYTTTRAAKQKKNSEKLHKTHVSPHDLQLYNAHLEGMCSYHHIHLQKAKKESEFECHYKALATHLNLAFCSFNARRATEGSFVTLQNYEERNNYSGKNSDALSKAQQELAERYDVLTSTGKGSTKVLSLLKPEWRDYFTTLSDKGVRAAAGIPESCIYLFGTKNGKPMDVRGPQKAAAEACLAERPDDLRARAIRTTFATTLGQMELSGPSKKLLCLLMGHSITVHDQYYDLPTGLGFNLMVGRALEIFQDGNIQKHKGTTLEQAAEIRTTAAQPDNADPEDDFSIEDLQDAILFEDVDEEAAEAELAVKPQPTKPRRGRKPGSKNKVRAPNKPTLRKNTKKYNKGS
ncbi:uncharacterized protein LOC135941083 [Cloeon dipterum]|uniref:uncharacterized protein LOC135941083 n=1 Tax=Cloeon dipterum TaxID=197152 RepID=UPI0032209759